MMTLGKNPKDILRFLKRMGTHSRARSQFLRAIGDFQRALSYRRGLRWANSLQLRVRGGDRGQSAHIGGELEALFDANISGPGVWKWRHYFEVYERHLARFRGSSPVVAEVGVFSGGSIGMWHRYFGEGCEVHGIDLDPRCRGYEGPRTRIHIGDQANRHFWRSFRSQVPKLDILIDDGGHTPEQQMVTIEEVFPHLAAGGVFICEDVHATGPQGHSLAGFVAALIDRLNQSQWTSSGSEIVPCQSVIESISLYPMMVVIEKRKVERLELVAERKGTEWQPPELRDLRGRQVPGRGV
jgi:hypothetical protein